MMYSPDVSGCCDIGPVTTVKAFYHGSITALAVGDILTSGFPRNFSASSRTKVSLTCSAPRAASWAQKIAQKNKVEKFFVYEVEPLDDVKVHRVSAHYCSVHTFYQEVLVSSARIIRVLTHDEIYSVSKHSRDICVA